MSVCSWSLLTLFRFAKNFPIILNVKATTISPIGPLAHRCSHSLKKKKSNILVGSTGFETKNHPNSGPQNAFLLDVLIQMR